MVDIKNWKVKERMVLRIIRKVGQNRISKGAWVKPEVFISLASSLLSSLARRFSYFPRFFGR